MKIHLETAGTRANIIRAYGTGQVTVNDHIYRASLIVTPAHLIEDWPPRVFAELESSHFEMLMPLDPELVILGTGGHLQFPHPALTRHFVDAHIGFEVMDTGAACRTYNVLMSEGRRVVAALLMIEQTSSEE